MEQPGQVSVYVLYTSLSHVATMSTWCSLTPSFWCWVGTWAAFGAGQEPGQLVVLGRVLGTISQCIHSYVCVILWDYSYVHILQFVSSLFCTRYISLS